MTAKPLFLLLFLAVLSSCGSSDGSFRMEGRFRNLNQGEFYIYDAERGMKDTIHVRDGRFEYERSVEEPTLLMLMFPNFSEMPIFARQGVTLKMKGDASHLRETEIKGDEVNEEMTKFRLSIAQQTPPEQRRLAALYVNDHPESPIGCYLVQRFFLLGDAPDYQQANKLAALLAKAQPDNLHAQLLAQQAGRMRNHRMKGRLPRFSARDTNGKTVDNGTLKSEMNVIVLWSSWNYDSQNLLHTLSSKQRDLGKRLSVVSICLDADKKEGLQTLRRDSITWPNVCDGMMWESPVLAQLGMGAVGDNILTDRNGNILARNLDGRKLREKLESLASAK